MIIEPRSKSEKKRTRFLLISELEKYSALSAFLVLRFRKKKIKYSLPDLNIENGPNEFGPRVGTHTDISILVRRAQ